MTGRAVVAVAAVCVVLATGCTADPGRQVSAASGAASSPVAAIAATTVPQSATSTFRPAPSSAAKPPASSAGSAGSAASAVSGPAVVTARSTDTPQGVAVAWLTALRSASFRDSPTAWVAAITPYVTPELEASYRSLGEGGMSGGQGWASFVLDGCVSAVAGPAGVIPPEAPASPVAAHVQVSATVTTACRTGRSSNEFIAATVLVTKAAGRWAVAAREF